MRGNRTDKCYPKIISYIKRYGPVPVDKLHKYLCDKHGLVISTTRSHLIKRMEEQNLITRIGPRYGKVSTSTFIAN